MNIRINAPTLATNYDRGFTPAHINDINPARFYSMTETIPGANIVVPKPLFVYSGKDLIGQYQSQNNRPGVLSSFAAAPDTYNLFVTVTGIGDVAVAAGRHPKLDRKRTRLKPSPQYAPQ